jgi:hypothetical protein
MKPKLKATIFVVSAFLLGGLVGALVNGAIMSRRSAALRALPPGPLFIAAVERAVKPDDNQRQAIKQILDRHAGAVAAAMQGFEEKMVQIMDSVQSDLALVLTSEQRQRLQESIERLPMSRMPPVAHDGPLAFLREQLDLSERQVSQIATILDTLDRRTASMIVREVEDPNAARGKISELARGAENKIKSILTLEQRRKYDGLHGFPILGSPGRGLPPFGSGVQGVSPPWDSLRHKEPPH